MKLTRYYGQRTVEVSHIRAIRDILKSRFSWGFATQHYELYFESECYAAEQDKELDRVIAAKSSQPSSVLVCLKSTGGRTLTLDSRDSRRLTIEVQNLDKPPEEILDALEPSLALERISQIHIGLFPSSAFIAHAFTDDGKKYANEIARFLELLGITCESGRAYSTSRVSDKVNRRLSRHDIFLAIATPHDDFTWITQEIATAAALNKDIFLLVEEGVELKGGILGDYEYIPFAKSQLANAFIPVLEGLVELRGTSGWLAAPREAHDFKMPMAFGRVSRP